jgi:hypothetical protein
VTERQRLLSQCEDGLEHEVLRSWQRDRLDPAAAERIAVALGIATATTLATGGTLAASATLAAAEATRQAGVGATHLLVLKWLAGGALCGLGVMSGTEGLRMATAPRAATETAASVGNHAASAPRRHVGLVRTMPERTDGQSAPASTAVPSTAPAPHARRAHPKGGAISVLPAPPRSTVAEQAGATPASVGRMLTVPRSIAWETVALDRARAAVRRGDAYAALAEVHLMQSHDHSGTFAAEFDRIEAWATRALQDSTRTTPSGSAVGGR